MQTEPAPARARPGTLPPRGVGSPPPPPRAARPCQMSFAKERALRNGPSLWSHGDAPPTHKESAWKSGWGRGDGGRRSDRFVWIARPARERLTTGPARLISTWSCRNPTRGLRCVGQRRHVNLFSMCAAPSGQTTGAQEARPGRREGRRAVGVTQKGSGGEWRVARLEPPRGGRGGRSPAPRRPRAPRAARRGRASPARAGRRRLLPALAWG